jgi:phosphoglycerate dehydrogenase-like enzyme
MKVIYNYATAPAFERELDALRARGIDVSVCPESDDERLFTLLPQSDVLWHCLRPVDRTVMDAAPRLKLVQKIGVGVNTIDLDYAKQRGIAVCNMPGTNSAAVAEHALALMLAVLRLLRPFDADVRSSRGWTWPAQRQDRLGEIGGRTVGLIGFGAVPQKLAPILTAMGANVIYTARAPHDDIELEYQSLDDLLCRADIVSLHVPLSDDTALMMNRARFMRMKAGSILVNTARGGLVDEPALIEALNSGPLMGAGLDVFADEPTPPRHALFERDDVVLTPHIAWLTRETLTRSVAVAVANCVRLTNAQPLLHRVV